MERNEYNLEREAAQKINAEDKLPYSEIASMAEKLQQTEEMLKAKELELKQVREDLQRRLSDQLLTEQMLTLHYSKEKELANQLRESKEKLEAMNKELIRKDKIKDEFVSIAAHELRTPIQVILGFTELGREGTMSPAEAFDGITDAALRLRKIATDILDVSRIESGTLSYHFYKVRINKIIQDIVKAMTPVLKSDVSLQIKLDEDVEVVADRSRLTQALANLISNAIKFTKRGKIKIETHVIWEHNRIDIEVSDTGKGIPEEIIPRLFEKFASKDPTGQVEHGTGLGLFITKGIVTAHNGEIYGGNNEEGGARFTVTLPIHNSS